MQPENAYSRSAGNNDDMNGLVGKSLGQLRIVERIGAGGMATVFKAYQPALDRYVAIKVLPTYHARDPIFVQRFVREARSVAKLAHPNIVQIHDFGEQENITFIVMEYVDSGTLKDRLKQQQRLTVPEAVDFMIQAAEGLDCAHRNGIIHRDVKPANMLLRKDGYLLLSDFGIAKILEGTTNLTRVGTGIGTPQYMSPEQGTGMPVDRRSDIYSLGIVMFHCLTGSVPFTADNPLSITVKHLNDPLPVERLRSVNVPLAIELVVVKMTAKAPPDRYQSAEALIDALTTALAVSHLSIPRPWRSSISSSLLPPVSPVLPEQQVPGPGVVSGSLPGASMGSTPGIVSQPLGSTSSPVNGANGQDVVTITCFRCGSPNPSTRLYCTTCGDDLSNRRAVNDRYLAPNGRPILALLRIGNRSYRFHQDVTTIGRTNGNDLVISGRTVSRRHARLLFKDGQWYMEDLQSANGTMVNNVRVYQPVILNDGDIIRFGDEEAIFNITY
ncbi:MAG TPA: protein kinase [Ktedonobacteraceae bacterium]|nr:protein kinase [Ktedonobacteraceae bacterium]